MAEGKELTAYAKVNLWLEVLGRREDGYHEISSLMTRISLNDRVTIHIGGEGIRVTGGGEGMPQGPENLAYLAARLFFEMLGREAAVGVEIKKRIPIGSGLGGGSSDAAATLTGLNQLLGYPCDELQLMEMGGRIGADVPFFIFRGPALARGMGERLTPVDGLPQLWLLLIVPPFRVSTGEAYAALRLGLTKGESSISINELGGRLDKLLPLLRNDLEGVVTARYPQILKMKERLRARGALGTLMTGSGGAIFGIFPSQAAASKAAAGLSVASGWRCFLVHNI